MRTLIRVMCIILCVWLLLEHNVTDGKRILAIVMASWYSHQVVYRSLLMALNKRGHELVVVTSNPMRDLTLKNYTEIELPFANKLFEQFSEETRPLDLSIFESTKLMWKFIHKIDDATFNEPGFVKLYGRDNNEKFDVVIVEALAGLSLFAMAHRFNAPLIGIMSVGLHNYHRYLFGSPIASSHLSNWEFIIDGESTSIWQRLWYFINTWKYLYLWVNTYASVEQEIVKKYLGKDMPNVIDIAKNMSILLVNENPAYGYVKPEQPNVVFFSGFHINKTPPLLPKDLRRFLDDATEGFIYVSLGSITSWSILSKETLENFVQVFSKLPYKIVLKSESDEWSSRKLDNVFISKWFPQQGILAHPNIKLYIYQGGLQSTEEAVHYAVPLLGIPIMFDQYARVQRLASLGVAIHLKLNELTRENFDAAIRRILTDKRKQARHLENEIDAKLVAFSKLGINAGARHVNADEVPLMDEEHVFENMASEIETLLAKLFSINERMSELQPNGAAMLHTMQRHKEILKDYKLEFNKIRNNFTARKDREDLLGSVRKEIDNYKSASGLNRREMYLKENQHIHNSDRLINDQISIAMETRDHLMTQRQAFKRIRTRFNDISNRFPAVNSLLQRINLRKRRDSVILGLVIGVCTFLMLLYAFH